MTLAQHLTLHYDMLLPPAPGETLRGLDQSWTAQRRRMSEPQQRAWDDAFSAEDEAFRREDPQGQQRVRWFYQRYVKNYLRCVAGVDRSVGTLLDWLDAHPDVKANTLVIYSSDQGFYLGDHGWYDKRWMYEESLRMPLLMSWPGRLDGGREIAELERDADGLHLTDEGALSGKGETSIRGRDRQFYGISVFQASGAYVGLAQVYDLPSGMTWIELCHSRDGLDWEREPAPVLAEVALRFGPPEFFAIQLLTFSSFVGLGGGSPLKSLVAILLGFILASVGLDIVTGQLRLTFGFTDLMKGFDFIIAVIGLFGIGEILLSVEEGLKFQGARTGMNLKVVLDTWRELPRYWRTFLRGSVIGFWMGFKPGGATPASFMSYSFAKRFSRHPERFGKGELEGVVAPETAAHAAGVAAILPMITLGIPGSPTAAVMLGGLIIWGLQPGPMLFIDKPDFVWGLIASMYLGNIAGLIVVLTAVPLFAAILRVPFPIIAPVIVVICAIGAYTVKNNMLDVWMMVVFGVVGYVFRKLDYPLAPMVLALVLGDAAESSFRQSMLMSQGDLTIFFSNWLVGSLTGLALVALFWPLVSAGIARLRASVMAPARN